MPSFKLDGRDIPFEPGDTIIKAAHRQGIEIPHYCWHPGLSVAANCRMCLVEIESAPNFRSMNLDVLRFDPEKQDYVLDKKPKLQPACQFAAMDGMVVKSESSQNVALARKNVQEFLLLNHPVDCPICDQAGECKLQDYYMSEQRTAKRMRDEPNHKPKGQVFGPTIVYDAERCIACTRCIRFCDEVVGDHMLDMRERGNLYEIIVSPGKKLEGDYTMMTEWVCPVGALTTSHWRHKGRVWLLKGAPSVCPGCATGCNMYLDADQRDQTAFRVRPRENLEVNKFWMCDDGMLSYQRIHQDRVTEAATGRGKNTAKKFDDVLKEAAEALAKVGSELAVVLSAQSSTEDNLVAAELAKAAGATLYLAGRPAWRDDKILRHKDQNPNRAGALKAAGVDALPGLQELAKKRDKYRAVLVLGTDNDAGNDADALGDMSTVVVLASHKGELSKYATHVLPVASWAEGDGSFVNAKGMSQGFKRALLPKGAARPAWEVLSQLAKAMKHEVNYKRFVEVRRALEERTGLTTAPIRVSDNDPTVPETGTPRSGV